MRLALGLLSTLATSVGAHAQELRPWTRDIGGAAVGAAVAVEGLFGLVGAPGEPVAGADDCGVVHFLTRASMDEDWIIHPTPILPPPPAALAYARFGEALATDGEWIAVGAPFVDTPGADDAGAAFLYRRSSTGVDFVTRLMPALPEAEDDHFGAAVDVAGALAIVGIPFDDNGGDNAGRATVYTLSGAGSGSAIEQDMLLPPDLTSGDGLGAAVAVGDGWLLVGAPGQEGGGAVYVYELVVGSGWLPTAKLPVVGLTSSAEFGFAIDVHGARALVGAPGMEAAFVFERSGAGAWTLLDQLDSVSCNYSRFGAAVSLDPERAAIGAPKDSAVVVFHLNTPTTWKASERFQMELSIEFGASVALSDERLLAGAPSASEPAPYCGMVQLIDNWFFLRGYGYGSCGACPCGNDAPYRGCRNSTTVGATLRAEGSASISLDALVLRTSDLPVGRSCRVIMGDGAMWTPVGSGRRAVKLGSEGFARLGLGVSDGAGEFAYGPSIGASSSSFAALASVGESWNFQTWYRDPISPCGPTKPVNFSNAVAVTFAP
mgnify:CR=1 FL=1